MAATRGFALASRSGWPARALVCLLLLFPSTVPGYEVTGRTWRGSRVPFRINPNFPDTTLSGNSEQQLELLRAAAAAWHDQSAASIELVFDGTTMRTAADTRDSFNVVSWVDENAPEALAATVIRGTGNRIVGFDIQFYARTSGRTNRWNGPRDPGSGTLDISGVAVHEFGHALGLAHTAETRATMFAAVTNRGTHLRTLHQDDLDGIEFLYGNNRPGADAGPAILSVTPTLGPGEGGNEVVLRGRNFTWTADTILRVDGLSVSRSFWEVESLGLIRILSMPAHAEGFAPLTVDNSLGIKTLRDAYRYGPAPPVLMAIEPGMGPVPGGITVTVTGANFTPSALVTVGGRPLVDPVLVDSGTIQGTLPAAALKGVVDVVLEQGTDRIELPGAFLYTPLVLGIADTEVPTGGRARPVDVLASSDTPLAGFSFGLLHDDPRVNVEDVVVSGTVAAGAVFARANVANEDGVTTFGVVLDFFDPAKYLPPLTDQAVSRILVDLDAAAVPGSEIPLRLAGDVGQPPIDLLFDTGTEKFRPFTMDGKVIVTEPPQFIRGDANGNQVVEISDAVGMLEFLFRSGPESPCVDATDVNDDAAVNLSDPVFLLIHLFAGGRPPLPPFPDPGPDPTADELDC